MCGYCPAARNERKLPAGDLTLFGPRHLLKATA